MVYAISYHQTIGFTDPQLSESSDLFVEHSVCLEFFLLGEMLS